MYSRSALEIATPRGGLCQEIDRMLSTNASDISAIIFRLTFGGIKDMYLRNIDKSRICHNRARGCIEVEQPHDCQEV